MPVYNGEAHLKKAIDSVLTQTFKDFEFLIVNDASPDGSRDLILGYDDPRIRLIDNEQNIGQSAAMNRGLELAKGKWIARLDQDDSCRPERLEKQSAYLLEHPDTVLLGCDTGFLNEDGELYSSFKPVCDELAVRWALMFDNALSHSSVIFDRDIALNTLGGYSDHRICMDYDMWCRFLPYGKVANLPDRLTDDLRVAGTTSDRWFDVCIDEGQQIVEGYITEALDLSEAVPAHWLDFVRSCRSFQFSRSSGVKPGGAIDEMYDLFCSKHPAAVDHPEIIAHRERMRSRYADVCARDRFQSIAAWRKVRASGVDEMPSTWRLALLWLGGAELRSIYRSLKK
jgi:glycosyltransferase involved in cell wall biosynthesis